MLTYRLQKCIAWLLDKSLITWHVPSYSFSEPFPQHSMYYIEYLKTFNRSCHLFSGLRSCLFIHLCLRKSDLSVFSSMNSLQFAQIFLELWHPNWASSLALSEQQIISCLCIPQWSFIYFVFVPISCSISPIFPLNFTVLYLKDWFLLSTYNISPCCYCITSFFSDSGFNLSLRTHIFP